MYISPINPNFSNWTTFKQDVRINSLSPKENQVNHAFENNAKKFTSNFQESFIGKAQKTSTQGLSAKDLKILQELRSRDREVRAHEQAHIAAGGAYVRSGASYQYQEGPDGHRYAVGGEVSIDTSEERDPRATIRKMDTVIKAALAPAKPSAKDRAVAAMARAKKVKAQMELAKEERFSGGKNVSGTIINTYA